MSSEKQFDKWNLLKKSTEEKRKVPQFKVREIFWTTIGENIGNEQSGQGQNFLRPVLVFKKFNNELFWGIPLTKTQKNTQHYFSFSFVENTQSSAILSQLKLFDAKRLERKIGNMNKDDFENLKKSVINLMTDNEL